MKLDDSALQALFAQRWADPEPRTALEQLVSDPKVRRLASRRLADTILQAHALAPDRWGFSDRTGLLRLNVGPAEAMFIVDGAIRLMIHMPTAINAGLGTAIKAMDPTAKGAYRSIPESIFITVPTDTGAGEAEALLDLFAKAHERHVASAIQKGLNGMTRRGHHPGLVDAVAAIAQVVLPQPTYVRVPPAGTLSAPDADAVMDATGAGEDTLNAPAPEGGRVEVTLSRVERNRNLRRQCLDHHGYRCAVCDIEMAEEYGPAAAGLIHVHHLNPVSQGERDTDPITDLLPVCPNCHMVVHAGPAVRTIQEVRAMRANARERSG